ARSRAIRSRRAEGVRSSRPGGGVSSAPGQQQGYVAGAAKFRTKMLTSRMMEFAGGKDFMAAMHTGRIIAVMLALSACSSTGTTGNGGSVLGSFAGASSHPTAASASIVAAMGGGLVGAIGANLSDGEKRRALEAE